VSRGYLAGVLLMLCAGFVDLPRNSEGRPQTPPPADAPKEARNPTSQNSSTFALEGTEPLRLPVTENIREEQRQQILHYFSAQIAATPSRRDRLWQPDFSSRDGYRTSIEGHRLHLRAMLGLVEPKPGTPQVKTLQEKGNIKVEDVSIPIDAGLSARALLFQPQSSVPTAGIIAIPPANQSREEFAGIVSGMAPAPWLSTLLENNVTVAVPIMVERRDDHPLCREAGNKDRRRVLWRAGFIVGRTLVGMEVQQVLALREFLSLQGNVDARKIAVMGEGQGGMTALYAGALDEGFGGVEVLDYFQQREECWRQPVDQALYGQLQEFGDAEVAALIAPRPLLIATTPRAPIPPASVQAEFMRAQRFYGGLRAPDELSAVKLQNDPLSAAALTLAARLGSGPGHTTPQLSLRIPLSEVNQARDRQFEDQLRYFRNLWAASDQVRAEHWRLNSTLPENRTQKVQQLRSELADLVGIISPENVAMHPRTALVGETDKFLAYDVFLDAVPGVEVYGQLLVPRGVAGHVETRLPAVICQHGFDGAPKYISGVGTRLETNDHFYHRFGQRLAERGYVVFAPYLAVPQYHPPAGAGANLRNPAGLGDVIQRADLINPLVRMSAALGMMRTSIELAKLRRVVDFLQSLRFVDRDQIGYYGLSYGGYCAIWMPPLEPRLKLTAISAFFNDWRTMLTDTTRFGSSYWSLPDEDFYNWNVLNRFVHTELIAAMWPRPVCVEYGSEDPVTTSEWHVRAWNDLQSSMSSWDMEGKIVDDDFIGPHTIHGIGTFFFLDRWLRPERPAGRDYGCRDFNYCDQAVAPGFHGYNQTRGVSEPYTMQVLDSSPGRVIQGQFYVSDSSPLFVGMRFKLARKGNPGEVMVKFGTTEGSDNVGIATIHPQDVYPGEDLWYAASLPSPARLDPRKAYFFEIGVASGHAPIDCYTVYGPAPLGGKDEPVHFGLSFRTVTFAPGAGARPLR